uniref:IQ motif and ubiquitin domain containing n=1 Tax=Sphaeramia orbicularis TaxID=375764 RepID=A0A673B4Y4_9TELE
MSEQTQTQEQSVKEEDEEEENTDNIQVHGQDTENEPPEDDKELERQREEPQEDPATVKVVLVPEGHVMTVAFAIGLSIQELKCHLASELRVPAEVLQISLDGKSILMELGVRPHGSTRIEMSSIDPNTHPLRPVRPPEQDNMPDVITVRVQPGLNMSISVLTVSSAPPQQKAFLGGYRHRLTNAEYHHATTQTLPRRRPDKGVIIFNRETQTVKTLEKSQATPCSASTQTSGIGCYISCMNDKLVTPGRYMTAAEYHDRRLKAVIYLQTCTRRWLAQQKVECIKRERDRRLAWLEMRERQRLEEKKEQMRDRRQRFWNPQKREDFNLMYQALENKNNPG